MDKRSGGIFIIALWSLCFLSVLAVIVGINVRQKLVAFGRIAQRQELKPLARAGVQQAIIALSKRPADMAYFSFKEDLRDSPGFMREVPLGEGMFKWSLTDEQSRININTADLATLGRLLRIVAGADEMQSQELAASITDWRDEDSELSIPIGSAEDDYYASLRYPYKAKNSGFQVFEEALLVKGMTMEIFDKVRPFITVFGDGKVNANTAPKEVLMALGLDPELAQLVVDYRKGDDGVEGTMDDRVFEGTPMIVPKVSQFGRLNDADVARLTQVVERFLGVDADDFRIQSESRFPKGAQTYSLECVVDRSGAVEYWRQP